MVVVYVVQFQYFFKYMTITNLLGPTVAFFASRAQSCKFGAFGAFLTGPYPRLDGPVF